MTLIYSLQETVNGIKNTRLSHVVSIIIISFLLLILSIVFIASISINRITEILHAERDLQAYLSNTLGEQEIMILYDKVSQIPGVKNVEYISKQKAAEEFETEFGENILDVLGENPLPSSFIISLSDADHTTITLSEFTAMLQEFSEFDEIVSEHSSFSQLVYFARLSKKVLWLLFGLVAVTSVFVISNTIRLIIFNRRHIIETMKLVGATHHFIRFPYLLQGAFQGILGGLVAYVVLVILLAVIDTYWPGLVYISRVQLMLVIVIGFCVGLGGSMVSIRRFLAL